MPIGNRDAGKVGMMNTNLKIRWFAAGAFTAAIIFAAFYFMVIAPIERNIEVTVDKIVAQRDAALAENAQLRQQLTIVSRQHNLTLSFPSPAVQ